MTKPAPIQGMHHLALQVKKLEATAKFYTDILGMTIEWQPDPDNIYLTFGSDNLALHRVEGEFSDVQRLDHLGFILPTMDDVDRWHDHLVAAGVPMAKGLKTHRDGARSFYFYDPDGNLVQMMFHPPISKG